MKPCGRIEPPTPFLPRRIRVSWRNRLELAFYALFPANSNAYGHCIVRRSGNGVSTRMTSTSAGASGPTRRRALADLRRSQPVSRDPELQRLLDESAIRDVLSRYGRGIDRMDHEALLSMFWPGAMDEHGVYDGPIEGYVEWLRANHRPDESWMHHNTTQRIEIDGDEAWTETYCIATNRVPASDGRPAVDRTVRIRVLRPLRAPREGVADRTPEGRLLAEHGLDGVRGLAVRADAPARVARQKGSVVRGGGA